MFCAVKIKRINSYKQVVMKTLDSMKNHTINDNQAIKFLAQPTNFCPVHATMNVFAGKWKMLILLNHLFYTFHFTFSVYLALPNPFPNLWNRRTLAIHQHSNPINSCRQPDESSNCQTVQQN